eukprot:1157461-Pelagomonas_calceolata.AAC.11
MELVPVLFFKGKRGLGPSCPILYGNFAFACTVFELACHVIRYQETTLCLTVADGHAACTNRQLTNTMPVAITAVLT